MEKKLRIALAGNPNSGKTTLFNALTGANQFVGNWPGVTVEKKEGRLKKREDVTITDLPGIYSLSPYTPEEVVARNYLINERPDAILNIVDGSSLERSLYLTTQLAEIGIPVVVALNMIDVVRKRCDKINVQELSRKLGCKVVEISALKGEGITAAAEAAIAAAQSETAVPPHIFSGPVEHAIAHIEEAALHGMAPERQRWYAVKIFERDEKVLKQLSIDPGLFAHIEGDIKAAEKELDDDAESIITDERYVFIASLLRGCYKKNSTGKISVSDRIDRVVTNRILGLPIFACIMFLVYYISWTTLGQWVTDFTNEAIFTDTIVPAVADWLTGAGCAPWAVSLVADGIIGGVGAVLGFVPQLFILFILLAILEDVGYMARVAFIMDRVFRKFGLSGKSFIPMLISSGCGVPGVMASRTIERDRDRKMTVMTTCFIPCSAKMPIVFLIAGALFGGSPWIATSAYFVGVAAVIISGIILKKTRAFAGEPVPFVMELPPYHPPVASNVFRSMWERGWSFIKRAGTIILASSVLIWALNSFTFESGFHYIGGGDEMSVLNVIGEVVAVIFAPLGFGRWQAAVATVLGLVAKENAVGAFGALSSMANADWAMEAVEAADTARLSSIIGSEFFGGSGLSGYSFMIFNLLCAPCFAAMGAIKREMNSGKWTFFAIGYMCAFAYSVSLIVYQLGLLFAGGGFTLWTAAAIALLAFLMYLLFRPNRHGEGTLHPNGLLGAAGRVE